MLSKKWIYNMSPWSDQQTIFIVFFWFFVFTMKTVELEGYMLDMLEMQDVNCSLSNKKKDTLT